MNKERCGNCKFFSENESLYREAFCKRYPPVLVQSYESKCKSETELWSHPVVDIGNWCGEWRRAAQRHDRPKRTSQ